MKKRIEIVEHIDTSQVYAELSDPLSGGVFVFL